MVHPVDGRRPTVPTVGTGLAFNANICYIMIILVWIGMALMFFYLPKFKD
jgi:hypothetical protein